MTRISDLDLPRIAQRVIDQQFALCEIRDLAAAVAELRQEDPDRQVVESLLWHIGIRAGEVLAE